MKQTEQELAFSRGVLVALGHVAGQCEDTMYDEIMVACDPKLIVEAAQDSEFDLAHLRKMGWATKSGRFKRKPSPWSSHVTPVSVIRSQKMKKEKSGSGVDQERSTASSRATT